MCVYSWFLTLHAFSACLKKKKKKKEERVVLRMGCSGNKTNRVTWYLFRFRFSFHYPWLGGVLAGPESLTHSLPPIKYYPSPTTLHLLPDHVTTGKTIPVPRFHSLLLIFSFSSASHCLAPTVCTRFFAWDCPRLARDFLPCDY